MQLLPQSRLLAPRASRNARLSRIRRSGLLDGSRVASLLLDVRILLCDRWPASGSFIRESMVDVPARWHCWLLDVPSEERRLVGLSCIGQSLLITALPVWLLVVRSTRLLVRHHRRLKVDSTAQCAVLHLCRE